MNRSVFDALAAVTAIALVLSGCDSSSTSVETGVPTSTQPPSSNQQGNGQSSNQPQPVSASPSGTPKSLHLQGFGVIREFGETDTAAMFGIVSDDDNITINSVSGPSFLGEYGVGELNDETLSHLFEKSSNPMPAEEKSELVTKYKGAKIIYTEGYKGALCSSDETEIDISVSGSADGQVFKATFQFTALPNAVGDCKFHVFSLLSQWTS